MILGEDATSANTNNNLGDDATHASNDVTGASVVTCATGDDAINAKECNHDAKVTTVGATDDNTNDNVSDVSNDAMHANNDLTGVTVDACATGDCANAAN